ncbi:ATP-dependent DNA helicase pif1-like [Microplitis mediator]|uniref:ATP-dependent DNA helicase pif1-like n=1 Tax=Microplitis mediator TaxID=375433 RepID=UPI002555AFAF|nr:ATP-dependent DNA helicase pif1-like [Microplitis mediator]
MGLLEDDAHWDQTLAEVSISDLSYKIRELFAVMLVFCQVGDPIKLWDKYRDNFTDDIKRRMSRNRENSELDLDIVYNQCLINLEDMVIAMSGKTLLQFGLTSPSREQESVIINQQYLNELAYDTAKLTEKVIKSVPILNKEQKEAYESILNSVVSDSGRLFFLDAPGGTGKTFLINLLLAKIRSEKSIAIAVASSGIAATLIDGGKTAHSTFKLPLEMNHSDNILCNISKQSDMAHVIREAKLIVWDECTMAHKNAIEALNRTLKDIRNSDRIMGGITVVLASDFRQTLPVVPRGNGQISEVDGRISIPGNLGDIVDDLTTLTDKIYPDINKIGVNCSSWLKERAILTPTNDSANSINNFLLEKLSTNQMKYKSIDTVVEVDDAVHYPVEFLHTLNPPGIPSHNLNLKIGAPIMLLRNLNPPKLCNGTRLQVKHLHKNIIEATILTGKHEGEVVFIPRIPLVPSDYHFNFKRLQFPVRVCYAMTINKAQGQSLKLAGVDLRHDCFSHGQFYVACLRVSSLDNLIILQPEKKTKNIVYKEVLSL